MENKNDLKVRLIIYENIPNKGILIHDIYEIPYYAKSGKVSTRVLTIIEKLRKEYNIDGSEFNMQIEFKQY